MVCIILRYIHLLRIHACKPHFFSVQCVVLFSQLSLLAVDKAVTDENPLVVVITCTQSLETELKTRSSGIQLPARSILSAFFIPSCLHVVVLVCDISVYICNSMLHKQYMCLYICAVILTVLCNYYHVL